MEMLTQLYPQWQERRGQNAYLYRAYFIVTLEEEALGLALGILLSLKAHVYSNALTLWGFHSS